MMSNNKLLLELAITYIRETGNYKKPFKIFMKTIAKNDEEAYLKSILKWELVYLGAISKNNKCGFCDLYYKVDGISCIENDKRCPMRKECQEIFNMLDKTSGELAEHAIEMLESRKEEFINN